jgi:hypothetical protein
MAPISTRAKPVRAWAVSTRTKSASIFVSSRGRPVRLLTMPTREGIDNDDEFLGFQDPSIKVASERSETPVFVVRRPASFANQPFENSRLLIQQVDDDVELLMDGCGAGAQGRQARMRRAVTSVIVGVVMVQEPGRGRVGRKMRHHEHLGQLQRAVIRSSGVLFRDAFTIAATAKCNEST